MSTGNNVYTILNNVDAEAENSESSNGLDYSLAVEEEEAYKKNKARSRANNIHMIFVITIWVIFVLLGTIILTRVYHYLCPSKLHWLSESQVDSLDGMLSTGVIGALIGKYAETMTDLLNKSKKSH